METEAIGTGIARGIVGHITLRVSGGESWLRCDGATLLINEYPALFAAIGARFGGDGVQTFKLPNLPDHPFYICTDGWFPITGQNPGSWGTVEDEDATIDGRVRAFRAAYENGHNPFGQGTRGDDLDEDALAWTVQGMQDAYNRGEDPLFRHPHMDEVDPEWLENQVRNINNAYAQGFDPFQGHRHVDQVPSEELEMQAQVVKDACARGENPHFRFLREDELDREQLEGQVKSLRNAAEQGINPMAGHQHVDQIDPEWLARQAQVVTDAVCRGDDPGSMTHQRVEDLDPEWLAMQARVLQDTIARAATADKLPDGGDAANQAIEPFVRFAREDEIDQGRLAARVTHMIDAYDPDTATRIEDCPEVLEEDEGRPRLDPLESAHVIAKSAAKINRAIRAVTPKEAKKPAAKKATTRKPAAKKTASKTTTASTAEKTPAKKAAAKKAIAKPAARRTAEKSGKSKK